MPYYVKALDDRRRVLGDEPPGTLWSINNLAKLHESWHQIEPNAGHGVTATEYRVMLEAIEAKDAITTEPAVP